jgi:competence protein ComEC
MRKFYLLVIVLYILLFLLRLQYPEWKPETEILKTERQFLDQRISQTLPSPQSDILSGILLGLNKDLPFDTKLALRDSSTLHIVVASGQNLSMVAGFFLLFSGLIKRKNAIILGLLAAFFYTILTGMQVPILRAAIMLGLASLARLFGRDQDGIWVLILTGALMLLVNPSWLTSISFQLSFLATFGVVVVAPMILENLKKLPQFISGDLSVSLAAQAMVMPIIAINFHQLSLVGLLANLFVLWTIPFIMIGGVVMLILPFTSILLNALLTYFIYIITFFSSLPFAWEYIGEMSPIFWVGYYLVLSAIMLSLKGASH